MLRSSDRDNQKIYQRKELRVFTNLRGVDGKVKKCFKFVSAKQREEQILCKKKRVIVEDPSREKMECVRKISEDSFSHPGR